MLGNCMNLITLLLAVLLLTACEKPIPDEDVGKDSGNVRLTFTPTTADLAVPEASASGQTRGTVTIGDYFSRLAVQLFDAGGQKVWDKVKTQTSDDDDFGTLSVGLKAGTYTVVAVGHSSPVTPTIKSTELVQFAAQSGVKNSDTFCHYGTVTVTDDGGYHELKMNRVTAMVRFDFTDATMPAGFAGLKADYTGGSANFNPSTGQGCTRSAQSETRTMRASQYAVFTFPYMSTDGTLKITLNALDADGNVLTTKILSDVPVTRNRITRCTGVLFGDGDFEIHQTAFGITVNPDWDGIIDYQF